MLCEVVRAGALGSPLQRWHALTGTRDSEGCASTINSSVSWGFLPLKGPRDKPGTNPPPLAPPPLVVFRRLAVARVNSRVRSDRSTQAAPRADRGGPRLLILDATWDPAGRLTESPVATPRRGLARAWSGRREMPLLIRAVHALNGKADCQRLASSPMFARFSYV